MSAELLLREFARIGDTPAAVVRLRDLVLGLAVRGRLVPQQPQDGSVDELLDRLRPARQGPRRGLRRNIECANGPVAVASLPFTVPDTWGWAHLVDICDVSYGFAFESSRFSPPGVGKPLIRIRDISATDTQTYFHGPFDPGYLVHSGDYLVGMDGDFNLRKWNGPEALLNQRVMRMTRWRHKISPRWAAIPLQMILDQLHTATSQTTVKHLSAKQVNGILIPLPPLVEQLRIVAKVDELMALCEQLSAILTTRENLRDALRGLSLRRLTTTDKSAAGAADIRCFLDQSIRLVSRPEHVAEVRQTVLDLAALGRLVPQDPTNEPAEATLARPISLPSSEQRRRKILRKAISVSAPKIELAPGWARRTVQQLYDMNAIVNYADGNHGSLYPRKSEFGDQGVIFVSAKDLVQGRVAWQSCSRLNEDRASQLVKGWAKGGDVLLTHNATVGRVARVEDDREPFLLGTSVTFYRLNPQVLLPAYFYSYLQSSAWQEQLRAIMAQTTRNQVSIQKQAEFVVRIPPVAEQERIAARVGELLTICDELARHLADHQDNRTRLLEALLHDALRGSGVTVPPGKVLSTAV